MSQDIIEKGQTIFYQLEDQKQMVFVKTVKEVTPNGKVVKVGASDTITDDTWIAVEDMKILEITKP